MKDWIKIQDIQTQKDFLIYLYRNQFNQNYIDCFYELTSFHNNYIFYEYLAICYERLGYFELCLKSLENALRLNPKLVSSYIKKGIIQYMINKEISESELNIMTELAIKKQNKMQENIRMLSMIYLGLKKYNIAKKLILLIENKTVLDKINLNFILKKINMQITDNISSFYMEFKKYQKNTKSLTIILSQSAKKNILNNYDFNSDRLYLRDLTDTYYALSYKDIYEEIKKLIKENAYKKVSLVTTSKGVLGEMNLFHFLQQDFPNIIVTAVGFAGFIRLYPFNEDIRITPSYMKLIKLMSVSQRILKEIKQMQEIAFHLQVLPKNKFSFIYGNKSKIDKGNGEFLKTCPTNIDILDFDYSGHSMSVPFTIPQGKSRAWLEEKYATIQLDNDLKTIDQSLLTFVDEIEAIYRQGLTLKDFL